MLNSGLIYYICTFVVLGMFFFLSFILEVISLSSDTSLLVLLYETGFMWSHGIIIIGFRVRKLF